MSRFPGVDYMDFESLLSPEERLIRDTVRRFVDDKVMPVVEEAHRHSPAPMIELYPEMGELGLLGATIDEYDLPGLGAVAYGLLNQELERGDSGVRSMASVQSALVMYPIWAYGSQEQKDHFLPGPGIRQVDRLLWTHRARLRFQPQRDAHHCQALRQRLGPQRAEDVDHQRQRRRRGGDLGTHGRGNRQGLSWSRRVPPVSKPQRFQASSRCARPQRASSLMRDCKVTDDAILPGSGGIKSPLSCLTQARYGIAWGGIGSAMECYNTALEYAKTRIQFGGQPIASHQIIQDRLAFMITEITKGQFPRVPARPTQRAGQDAAAARVDGTNATTSGSLASAPN